MHRRSVLSLPLAVVGLVPPTPGTSGRTATGTTSEVMVHVGQPFAATAAQVIRGILDTETNILATEQQIAEMSDRIVYVTQLSQTGALDVIYRVISIVDLGIRAGASAYSAALVPVGALPVGW